MKTSKVLLFGSICIASAAASMISGCGSSKNEGGREASAFVTESDDRPLTYTVSAEEVTRDGCLNLQLLFERLHATPDSTVVRRYTKDFDVEADKESRIAVAQPELPEGVEHLIEPEPIERGPSVLRRNFAEFLVKSTYVYREETLREFVNGFGSFVQDGCQSLSYTDGTGATDQYKVQEVEPSYISIKAESGNGRAYEFRLIDSQTLEVTKHNKAMDFCSNKDFAVTKSTQVVRWGGADVLSRSEERILSSYLKRVGGASANSLGNVGTQTSESDEFGFVLAPVSVLQQVADSGFKPGLQDCPGQHESPGTAPVQPESAPTPSASEDGGDHTDDITGIDADTAGNAEGALPATAASPEPAAPSEPEVAEPAPSPSPSPTPEASSENANGPNNSNSGTGATGSASGEGAR